MATPKPILFYSRNQGHEWLSNFFHANFKLDGKVWPSVEHFYVAQKNLNPDWQDRIRKTENPGRVKRLGRKVELRRDWDKAKIPIMYRAVYAKFSQNPHLKEALLSTGEAPLHEDCKDPWWGGGPNFPKGRDLLGKTLIRVREQLRRDDG